MPSAGFRTYEAMCQLSYEDPYLGSEGGRPGRPTQTVRHTCSGKLGIIKILGQACTLRLQQTRSYYILHKAPTRPTLSYTGHIMKQSTSCN